MLKQLKNTLTIKKELKALQQNLRNINKLENVDSIKSSLAKFETEVMDFQGKYINTKYYNEKLNSKILELVFKITIIKKRISPYNILNNK